MSISKIRVRFAPSPTGHLHIGNFRTALFNWLFARHNNGTFLVRIEDTDKERSKQEYAESILYVLNWSGLLPDEPYVIQTEQLATHQFFLQKLLDEKKAYKCYCSEQDVIDRYAARGIHELYLPYDQFCKNIVVDKDKPYVIRFSLPSMQQISFNDLIRGEVTFSIDQFDDFIIARSDGSPMYNFVVVVDDHTMNISHVIRGEDHISNTPKQILIGQACGFEIPLFAHIPLILGPSGDRLSKRDAATSILEYIRQGFLPEATLNYLVRLGWAYKDQEIFSVEELVKLFTIDTVGKKGAIFDIQKFLWINGMHIREKKPSELISYIHEYLYFDFNTVFSKWNANQIETAITLYQPRVSTLKELIDDMQILYSGPERYEDLYATMQTMQILQRVKSIINQTTIESKQDFSVTFKSMGKELGVTFVDLIKPLRIALIGKSSGPGVFELIMVLGKSETIKRIQQLVDWIDTNTSI